MQIELIVKVYKCNFESRMWIFLLTFVFKNQYYKPYKSYKLHISLFQYS